MALNTEPDETDEPEHHLTDDLPDELWESWIVFEAWKIGGLDDDALPP